MILDEGLKQFARTIERQTAKDIAAIPGTGVAGGIAAGLMAFLPVTIHEGTKLSVSKLEDSMTDPDLVITSEGKIDTQSGRGKTISAVASLANKYKVPVGALCGKLELDPEQLNELGIRDAVAIHNISMSEAGSMRRAFQLVSAPAESLYLRMMKSQSGK